MDKMYANLQVNYDKGTEQRLNDELKQKNSKIMELKNSVLILKQEAEQAKESQKLVHIKQISKDVSTDSLEFNFFEIESLEIRSLNQSFCNCKNKDSILSEEKQVQIDTIQEIDEEFEVFETPRDELKKRNVAPIQKEDMKEIILEEESVLDLEPNLKSSFSYFFILSIVFTIVA
mmetsp:Transcript_4334/g.3638  ORF Transcript_4334/g.3638 Transcript_4334/m.3638 type:complete len:175 (+) Transcript_4334:683-1207(+)